MNYPDLVYLGAADTKGYPAKVACLPTDEYLMNPDRDPDNDGKLIIPIWVFASPENGGGYQMTSHWRDPTPQEKKRFMGEL